MFRNAFQGGSCVDLFNPVDKKLCTNWFIAKNVLKHFDKTAKTMSFLLKGEPTLLQMSLPKDRTKALYLLQPYLVLQIFYSETQRFSLDVRISCKSGSHRRVSFLSHSEKLKINPLFASLPLCFPSPAAWFHLVINCEDVVAQLWREQFLSIDSIALNGACQVRQIYTVHQNVFNQPDSRSWEFKYMNSLPKKCHFPATSSQCFHLIDDTLICAIKSLDGKKTSISASSVPGASCKAPKPRSLLSSSVSRKFGSGVASQHSRKLNAPVRVIVTTQPPGEQHRQSSAPISVQQKQSRSTITFSSVLSEPDFNTLQDIHFLPEHLMDGNNPSDVGDSLPQYNRRVCNRLPLSPVSNALSLARAISSQRSLASDDVVTPTLSIHDLFAEYGERKPF